MEDVQRCTTGQHYATTHKDSFATKFVDSCYVGGMKMQLKRSTRLNDALRVQVGCRLFNWKFFFHTQQQDHEQAEKPLSTYVVVRSMTSSEFRCFVARLSALPGDSTICLELIP
ncbi:hypothetical protein TNCV_486441 [Trichonephila clavipes]|nr:hypothetical protein TNCV_486441 [Trichonephila clavipes]